MTAMAIFRRVVDIMRIKIGHFKGESSGSLDSNELDIEAGSKLLKGTN